MMLQQTTVNTVLSRYSKFLQTFPSAEHLAKASEDKLLLHWQGLGYYRRARYLQACAKIIVEQGEEAVASNLLRLPGVGEYTANAIKALVYGEAVISFDVNVRRVLSRYFACSEQQLGQDMLPLDALNAGDTNEAIMDIGREFCRANRADCSVCPLEGCLSRGKVVIEKKKSNKTKLDIVRFICMQEGRVLLVQRPKGSWLVGQWELPSFFLKEQEIDQYPLLETRVQYQEIARIKSSITRYSISNILVRPSAPIKVQGKWVSAAQLAELPLSSITRKLLRLVPEAGLEPARF